MVYFWLIFIPVALVLEAVTTALVAIWFIPGAAVSALIAYFGGSIVLQVVVFLILTILFTVFARRLFAGKITPKPSPTNADALIGEIGIVKSDINNIDFSGSVKVKGQVWSALSDGGQEIESGKNVEIISIKGVRLIVKER